MAKLTLTTAPSGNVVSIEDLRLYLRIDSREEDTLLQSLHDDAVELIESHTWRRLLTQTWTQYFDGFEDPLVLRYPPLQSVSSVTYTDSNGDSQTLSTSTYEAGELHGLGVVRLKYDQTWPATRDHEDVVAVQYACGYGSAKDVPEPLRNGVRRYVGWYFRNRENEPLPDRFWKSLSGFRRVRYGAA